MLFEFKISSTSVPSEETFKNCMQLHTKEDPSCKEDCMITHDSLSGYDEKSTSPKVSPENWENSFRSLSLRTKSGYIYDELPTLLNAQQLILRKCRQTKAISFQECYPESVLANCHKIGEGLYGEVFLYRNPKGGTTVMKVIPIEGDQIVNGEHQKKFEEVLSEIIIATKLSNLRYNRINQTDAFIDVQNIRYVQGRYPENLLDLWKLYEETNGSENDPPDIFKDDQLYVILETNYAGCDMESFIFDDASQAFSMFIQVACAIAVAEEEFHFEHRDLHWGNILLSRVSPQEKMVFKLDGREIKVDSCGIKVSIIDFTMSRISCNTVDVYTDLGKDCDLFTSSGDYQFEVYKLMQKKNGNEWSHYEPYSNILWLSYILDKTITALHYKNACCKLHKKYISKLKKLNLEVLGYDSTKELVLNLFGY